MSRRVVSQSFDQQPNHAALSTQTTTTRRKRFWLLLGVLFLLLICSILVAVALGAVALPVAHVAEIIVNHLFPGSLPVTWDQTEDLIVWELRLPRVLLAVVVGAALAVSGTTLQALIRNPLADPYIFGISSGASVGAVAVLTLGPLIVGSVTLGAAAFAGALVTMVLVYLLAQQGGRLQPQRLLLAGVALGYTLSSVTSYLVLRSSRPGGGVEGVLVWLAGTLAPATWETLGLPAGVLLCITAFLLFQARALNALLMGEETAISLGIHLTRLRLQLFVLTSLLVGAAVAASGAIGFVGLMIPHIVRFFVGSDHRRVLPISVLVGGIYLVLADLLARIIIAPQELPVGLITAALGGPFFLWLMRQRKRSGAERP